jgi:hypothetical protein
VREEPLVAANANRNAFKLTSEPAILPAVSSEAAGPDAIAVADSPALREIEALNAELETRWRDKLVVANELTRSLVSFQANKSRALCRV